jgi:hypothetical protein
MYISFEILFLSADSSDDESELEPEDPEAPVLLRRKRYVPLKDRKVNSLESSMNPNNYDLLPPVIHHRT